MSLRGAVPLALSLTLLSGGLESPALARNLQTEAQVRAARHEREAAPIEVEPAPLPHGLPLIGDAGFDSEDFPTQYVDRTQIKSLLLHGRYRELTRDVEDLQSRFEADVRYEYWPEDAALAFDSPDPHLRARLDAWVKSSPRSFAPYLARGVWGAAVALARRGGELISQTADSDVEAMNAAARSAVKDLDHALALRPKAVAALIEKLGMVSAVGTDEQVARIGDQADRLCPTCLRVHVARLTTLEPRWHGTHEAMKAYAERWQDPAHPRNVLLEGYADLDAANANETRVGGAATLRALNRVCELGESPDFLLARGEVRLRMDAAEMALPDLERAVALRPFKLGALVALSFAEKNVRQWRSAGEHLLTAMRLNPSNTKARSMYPIVLNGLRDVAEDALAGERWDKAADELRLARALAPTDRRLLTQEWRARLHQPTATDEDVEKAILAAPIPDGEALRAYRERDAAIGIAEGDSPRRADAWTAYLAEFPDDPLGYDAQAEAYAAAGKGAQARADWARSCSLGSAEGCERARKATH